MWEEQQQALANPQAGNDGSDPTNYRHDIRPLVQGWRIPGASIASALTPVWWSLTLGIATHGQCWKDSHWIPHMFDAAFTLQEMLFQQGLRLHRSVSQPRIVYIQAKSLFLNPIPQIWLVAEKIEDIAAIQQICPSSRLSCL